MKKQIIILSSVLLLTTIGCKKGFLDINNNPNAATNTTPELVLPTAIVVTASGQVTNNTFLSEWMGYWAVSGSYAISASGTDSYRQTTGFGNGIFISAYRNLEDYDYVEQAAKANKSPFYEAAAKTMKAYVFQQLVDLFNNVPYSDALHGTGSIQPKYDDGKAIYESIALKLDTAVTLMQRADAIGKATSDPLFHGNAGLWVSFMNSLKLRILMRQTEISGRGAYIQAGIAKIISNGGNFLTVDAGVNPGYNSAQPNPLFNFFINTAGTYTNDVWRANQYYITFDKNNNDPRYIRIYKPASDDGTYKGNVVGSPTNHPGNASSAFGPGIVKSSSQDAILMTASESYFLQAEAVLRGFISGDAATLYKQGVQASFDYYGSGDASGYYSQPGNKNTTYEAATNFQEQLAVIIRQKWASENSTLPVEAYADYRRLHLPADIPISVSPYLDVPAVPTRILYPSSEYATNATNVAAQGTINHHTSKIFWMP